jgi:tripartite-type tricarboxylate transporter receptor subunit TctC
VTGDTRSRVAPAVPTLAESGVAGYEFKTWYGIQVPALTPSAVISTLNGKVSEILGRTDVVEQLAAVGLEAHASTPAEFGALIESEIRKWARVVQASGARID